jgi:hypothetical protein
MYNKQNDILEYKKFKFENLFQKFSQQSEIINYVKDNLIYLGVSGSYAYGLETETSDLDVVGIFKDNIEMILGYKKVDQIEYKDEQLNLTIYSLSKALKLIMEQNPNMIELLWNHPDEILFYTYQYIGIRDDRHLMLSKLSRHKFTGYAMAQMKRIRGHEKWLSKELSGQFEKKPEMIDFCRIINVNNGYTFKNKDAIFNWSQLFFLTHETNTIYKIWKLEAISGSGWFDNENCTFYFKEDMPLQRDFQGILFFSKIGRAHV